MYCIIINRRPHQIPFLSPQTPHLARSRPSRQSPSSSITIRDFEGPEAGLGTLRGFHQPYSYTGFSHGVGERERGASCARSAPHSATFLTQTQPPRARPRVWFVGVSTPCQCRRFFDASMGGVLRTPSSDGSGDVRSRKWVYRLGCWGTNGHKP